jgi:hypothetical protein
MGNQSIRLREVAQKELFGLESREYSFCAAVWKYTHLLWRCFRLTAGKEAAGSRRDEGVFTTVAEVKDDLRSVESLGIVQKFMALKLTEQLHLRDDPLYRGWMFSLVMYRFCEVLIVLLERKTIIEATSSADAISAATVALLHVPSVSFTPTAFHSAASTYYLPRILSVAGLVFPKTTHPERIPLVINHLISLVAKSIVDQLEIYEQGNIASGLEKFWESGDITHVLEILSTSTPKEESMLVPQNRLRNFSEAKG